MSTYHFARYDQEIALMEAASAHLVMMAKGYLENPEDIETQEYLVRAGSAYMALSESGTDWSELARLARQVRLYGASDAEKIREQVEYIESL